MDQPSICILTPVHQNCEVAARQFLNYSYFLRGSKITFLYHLSRGSNPCMKTTLSCMAKLTGNKLYFSPYQAQTSYISCFSAILSCADFIKELGIKFDYIYLHSDSDLLIRDGIVEEMARYSYGIMRQDVHYATWEWDQAPMMRKDDRLAAFMHGIGIPQSGLVFGRAEGSFFDWASWNRILDNITQFFSKSDSYFENASNHWTAEEIVIPTAARHLLTSSGVSRRDQLVFAKLIPDGKRQEPTNMINNQELFELVERGKYYGAKRFNDDLGDLASGSIYPSPATLYQQ